MGADANSWDFDGPAQPDESGSDADVEAAEVILVYTHATG